MSKIKKPASPTEIPKPGKDPEVTPDIPENPVLPEKEPEILPEREPEEPDESSPAEIPVPQNEKIGLRSVTYEIGGVN